MRRVTLTLAIISALCLSHKASAQFYKPVVRLMGSVTDRSGKPIVARVSVRDAADTTKEIGNSSSNSATGKYLVIIQPSHSYLLVVRGDSLVPQSRAISTDPADHNIDLVQDFTVQ